MCSDQCVGTVRELIIVTLSKERLGRRPLDAPDPPRLPHVRTAREHRACVRWQTGLRLTGPEPRRFLSRRESRPRQSQLGGIIWRVVPVGSEGDSSVDRIQKWGALVGRRNIAYVVFVSLLVPFGMLMEAAGHKVLIPVAGLWPR